MKFINLVITLSLVLFIGCGGESSEQEQTDTSTDTQEQEMASEDVRTINVIGIDNMQFVVEEEAEGITLGDSVGADNLPKLVSITAQPGEQISIHLTTKSTLPATAMAHNWLLLTMNADVEAFANAAMKARDNDYVPTDSGMQEQIIAQTGLAAGGETTEVTFTVPEETGEYEFICTFPGHFTSGMRGTLIVEE